MTKLSSCLWLYDSNFWCVCVCCAKETCNDLFPKSSWITKFRMLINILHAANHLVSWEAQGYCIAEAGKTKRCYREREMLLQDTPGILPLYPKRSAVSKDINLWNEEDWWKDCLCLHACLRACLVECLACISWVAMRELVKVLWITQRMVVRCEWLYACQRIEDAERGDLYSPQGSRMFEGKKLHHLYSPLWQDLGAPVEHHEHLFYVQNVPKRPKRPKTSQNVPRKPLLWILRDYPSILRTFPDPEEIRGSLRFSADFVHTCPTPSLASRLYLACMKILCFGNHAISSSVSDWGSWLLNEVEVSWGAGEWGSVSLTGSLLECHCIQPRKLKVSLWDLFYCILYI